MFILFTTESVIFILTQLNESCVCLLKGTLERQKYASKIEKNLLGSCGWILVAGGSGAGSL